MKATIGGVLLGASALLTLAGCATTAPGPGSGTEPSAAPAPALNAETVAKIEAGLVLVPAGTLAADFRSQQSFKTLKPDPAVKIPAFWLGRNEVTREEWRAVMGSPPGAAEDDPLLPVADVTWAQANEFVGRLNEARGKAVFRLPTSEEWEYACRAGARGHVAIQGKESTLSEYAWWGKNSGGEKHPVASRKANAWGLHDMLGNVAEWCATESDVKLDHPLRVTAGANFADENLVGQDCHPGGAMAEGGHDRYTGFRLAKAADPPSKSKSKKKKPGRG